MPKFSQEDFTPENATRLSVIVMSKLGKPPLSQFRDLVEGQKRKFNRLMNEYIQSLGEDWKPKLLDDFNTIINEDVMNEEFDPSKIFVKDYITERNVLLSPEQEEWIKSEEAEGRKVIY